MRDDLDDRPEEREPLDAPPPLDPRSPETTDTGWGWGWLWILFFALFLFAGWGLWRAPEPHVANVPTTTPPPAATSVASSTSTGVTTGAVSQNDLSAQLGKDISLSGKALRTEGSHAFVLSSEEPNSGDVLVITKQQVKSGSTETAESNKEGEQPLNISTDGSARYKVDGKVEMFKKEDMEKELGEKLDDIDGSRFDDKPVIVANSIKPMEEAR